MKTHVDDVDLYFDVTGLKRVADGLSMKDRPTLVLLHWGPGFDHTSWAETMASTGADMAVVLVGPWDVKDRRLPGDSTWRSVGDPEYDTFLFGEMTKAVDVLSARGAHVVWLTTPPVAEVAKGTGQPEWRELPPIDRVERFNDMVKRLPAARPQKVAVVDFAEWVRASGRDAELRPDGVHLDDRQAQAVASQYLAKAVLDADASLGAIQR